MRNNKKQLFLLIFCLALLFSCKATNYHRLTDEKFPKKSKNQNIDLFMGKVGVPYKPVAVVQSKSYKDKSEATRKKQILEIEKAARNLGADAIHQVRILENEAYGYIRDYYVPFKSWKQGEYKLYFIRGEAIKYTEKKD